MFSFVQRLPTDLGRTFIAARQGQASNKAEQVEPVQGSKFAALNRPLKRIGAGPAS